MPLVYEHWWENNKNRGIVATLLSIPVLALYLLNSPMDIVHSMMEYFSFIVLLWSLYTISGGIVLRGNFTGKPLSNTAFLAIGAIIANIFGTTGAAMLLIRPLLRSIEHREHKKHVIIFFIFLVANIGGCLTPLGDPPLFLGYLRGVPFEWTLKLFPVWFPTVIFLLGVFYVWDSIAWKKEKDLPQTEEDESFGIDGNLNFLFIAGVLLATIFSPSLNRINDAIGQDFTSLGLSGGGPWREIIMIAMGLLSLKFTRKALRKENRFNWDAIAEVAILFAGIFITMIPALALLKSHGDEMGLTQAWQYMWTTGILSSFLDNAPTYLVFSTAADAYAVSQGMAGGESLATLAASPDYMILLKAVSIGAVFMGANTYIGNAPNFMVKVIADTAGNRRVKMPSFFGYLGWSCLILIPTFIVVTYLAFFVFGSYI